MPFKRLISPHRRRKVPAQFSWVDHRLVRDNHISKCSPEALALYLFLVTVADAEGLSYYSDRKAAPLLGLDRVLASDLRVGILLREPPISTFPRCTSRAKLTRKPLSAYQ